MALLQVCPTALTIAGVGGCGLLSNQGHRLQFSALRPGGILWHNKKHSSRVSGWDSTSCANSGSTRAPPSRAALDDADKRNEQPREKSESAFEEMSAASRGHSGQLQEKHGDGSKDITIRPSLASIVFVSLSYVGLTRF